MYSAENHDWDLTLYAACELLQVGKILDQTPSTGSLPKGFSAYVGSMILSFASIESFSASVAFAMPQTSQFESFDFEGYRKSSQFSTKLEMLFDALGQPIDKSQGIFQDIEAMRKWRNLVVHASPYQIEPVPVENTTNPPSKNSKKGLQYAHSANIQKATKFYRTASEYIELLKDGSGLEPHASITYQLG